MNADFPGLSESESSRVQAVLRADEQVVMVVKPSTAVPKGRAALLVLCGVVMVWKLVSGCVGLQELHLLLLLGGLPVWVFGLLLCFAPVFHKLRMARTLYVLTDRRAVVLAPGCLHRERVVSFPLHLIPQPAVQKRAGGYGDILFAWELRWCPGLRVYSPVQPVGFLSVPQVERVAQMLAEQVAALPQVSELPKPEGVRPLTLRKGRPRFDSVEQEFLVWAGVVACGISCLLQLTAAHYLPRECRFGRDAVTTYATVLSLRRETSFWNSPNSEKVRVRSGRHAGRAQFISHYPTVQFEDTSGRMHTVELATALNPRRYHPGEKVLVRYDRRNPQQVVLGRVRRTGSLCCIMSCVFYVTGGCLMAAGLLYKTKRKST